MSTTHSKENNTFHAPTRNTSPNLRVRAQNLKVILSLNKLDTNASQTFYCTLGLCCAAALTLKAKTVET